MSEPPASPRVELTRISPTVPRLTIAILPGDPAPDTPEVRRAWDEMVEANPRLYNGPILAVESIDERGGVIRARRDTYRRLAVQPRVPTGVRQLSVTGVVIGYNRSGEPSVLLGRRSERTRMYAGLWELGPSGGIDPPAEGVEVLDHAAVVKELAREAREESGIDIRGVGVPLAIVYDPHAESYDVVLKVHAGDGVVESTQPRGWEYQETHWVPVRQLRDLERTLGPQMIPSTREIILSIDLVQHTQEDPVELI